MDSQTGERDVGGGKLTVTEVFVLTIFMAQTWFAIGAGTPFAHHRLAATIARPRKAWGGLALARPARTELAHHSLQTAGSWLCLQWSAAQSPDPNGVN